MSRYVVTYTKELFPLDESRICTVEVATLEEVKVAIKNIPIVERWNVLVYDKEIDNFI